MIISRFVLRLILCFCCFYLSLYSEVEAHSKCDQEKSRIARDIEANYYTFDTTGICKVLRRVESHLVHNSNDWHYNYYAGFLNHQLGKILYNVDKDRAYDCFSKAIDYFYVSVEQEETAELLALLSSAYGKKSSLSSIRAIYFGIKARDLIYQAEKYSKKQSCVLLVGAIHLMHTPESFGGNKDWARKLLKKCLKLNAEKKSEDSLKIHWACDAEIYAYMAQIDILEADIKTARKHMKKALGIEKGYDFVLKDLEDQIKKVNQNNN